MVLAGTLASLVGAAVQHVVDLFPIEMGMARDQGA
jgi:hypothetical protein